MIQAYQFRHSGFTLIEVLAAVLVFGLLAAISYGSLTTLATASADYRDRSTQFAEIQRSVAFLDNDLRQLVSRAARQPDGSMSPALAGARRELIARRAGRDNPSRLPRSQLQQFAWRLDGRELVREVWPNLVISPDTGPSGQSRFGQITAMELRYRDANGAWHRQWPAGGRPETLPSAIEYVLETARFGRIRRLIAL
ncbi:MAG: type II secretion system minor pseudopilin GspJ [Wenzhouxiangellaceae bacterium]|nr:type II secretion system minor pseudopilin GspJ [Wenzhouxiangellaceae bacterium]